MVLQDPEDVLGELDVALGGRVDDVDAGSVVDHRRDIELLGERAQDVHVRVTGIVAGEVEHERLRAMLARQADDLLQVGAIAIGRDALFLVVGRRPRRECSHASPQRGVPEEVIVEPDEWQDATLESQRLLDVSLPGHIVEPVAEDHDTRLEPETALAQIDETLMARVPGRPRVDHPVASLPEAAIEEPLEDLGIGVVLRHLPSPRTRVADRQDALRAVLLDVRVAESEGVRVEARLLGGARQHGGRTVRTELHAERGTPLKTVRGAGDHPEARRQTERPGGALQHEESHDGREHPREHLAAEPTAPSSDTSRRLRVERLSRLGDGH